MGRKVNPHGLRIGIIKDWDANGMPTLRTSATSWLRISSFGSY